jgi:hypothetical protein
LDFTKKLFKVLMEDAVPPPKEKNAELQQALTTQSSQL